MPQVSYQTIKLSKGKHLSPEHGACVMELASMLAGGRFSDHPSSVSRPIASFLRSYLTQLNRVCDELSLPDRGQALLAQVLALPGVVPDPASSGFRRRT